MNRPTCGTECRQIRELGTRLGNRLHDGSCNVCTWADEYEDVVVVSLRGYRFNLCLAHAGELAEALNKTVRASQEGNDG